jgi:hypothetical protein
MNDFLAALTSLLSRGFQVSVRIAFPPSPQRISGINYVREKGSDLMTGQLVLNPANPAESITSRPVDVAINGGPATTLDMIDPAVTFPVNPGDSVVATPKGDVNSVGQGPADAPFSATAPPPVGGVPSKQTVTGINWA